MQRLRSAAVSPLTRARPPRPPRRLLTRLACVALLCAAVAPLAGWSNGTSGGDSFGTHDWVVREANVVAAASGYTWLDVDVAQIATDDPDSQLHDFYHHVYDVWGSSYGDAPTRIAALYAQTVAELKAGDRVAASRSFGLLSHYYSDINNPLHTDQVPQEKSVHSSYELAAQRYTDAPGENAAWVVPDGIQLVSDPAEETRLAAANAHRSYQGLVGNYSQGRMNPAVVAITSASLNRASNDLADLIASAGKASGVAGAIPSVAPPATPVAPAAPVTPAPSMPAAEATATEDSTSSAVATVAVMALDPEPPTPRMPSGPPLALAFWVVAGSVFSISLFGALGAERLAKA